VRRAQQDIAPPDAATRHSALQIAAPQDSASQETAPQQATPQTAEPPDTASQPSLRTAAQWQRLKHLLAEATRRCAWS
jgi:hypothetical protein